MNHKFQNPNRLLQFGLSSRLLLLEVAVAHGVEGDAILRLYNMRLRKADLVDFLSRGNMDSIERSLGPVWDVVTMFVRLSMTGDLETRVACGEVAHRIVTSWNRGSIPKK